MHLTGALRNLNIDFEEPRASLLRFAISEEHGRGGNNAILGSVDTGRLGVEGDEALIDPSAHAYPLRLLTN
jgi:hypothetical protein